VATRSGSVTNRKNEHDRAPRLTDKEGGAARSHLPSSFEVCGDHNTATDRNCDTRNIATGRFPIDTYCFKKCRALTRSRASVRRAGLVGINRVHARFRETRGLIRLPFERGHEPWVRPSIEWEELGDEREQIQKDFSEYYSKRGTLTPDEAAKAVEGLQNDIKALPQGSRTPGPPATGAGERGPASEPDSPQK